MNQKNLPTFWKMIKFLFFLIGVGNFYVSTAQDFELNNQWYTIGPLSEPTSKLSSKGIGPVEFIRTTSLKKGLILAGSLHGGLFFTTDGGENWINAGSDSWRYSTATWAEFYPENENIWFASSHERESNGKPGRLGIYGGIYRTKDGGTTWDFIADKNSFNKFENIVIYGFRFHPQNPKKLYVFTSDNIYYTTDCLADKVIWQKESRLKGKFYDLDFVNNTLFTTGVFKGKWNVYYEDGTSFKKITEIEAITEPIIQITIEPYGKDVLILVDFKTGADKLFYYSTQTQKIEELSRSMRVTFGAGHTFKVNPHAQNEIFVGSSTRLRKWNINTKRFINLGSGYHVDVEYVEFDPFDENKIYMASHGGFVVSNDKGETWKNKSNGLGIAEVMGMAVGVSDPYEVAIGTFHDGSIVYADWDKNGKYYWRNVNGGDALIPLINPENAAEVYTSNQYTGGGVYYSNDTAKTVQNIHAKMGLKTSGWEMATALHPTNPQVVFFNFVRQMGEAKGNIDVVRTSQPTEKSSYEIISDFKQTHNLKKYKVYGLYTSQYHPDILMAYVLHYTKDEKGKAIVNHRLFRTEMSLDSAGKVINNWHEIETPRNGWIADVVIDKKNKNKLYFSYSGGVNPTFDYPDETGMIYFTKYKKRNNQMKRNHDISLNIPNNQGKKYNLVYTYESDKYVFIGTRNGVYVGNKFNLKGGGSWKKVGYGLPHCAVYGLHYDQKQMLLTVGLKGRGVWRVSLMNK